MTGRYQLSGPSPFPTPKEANVPSLPFQKRGISSPFPTPKEANVPSLPFQKKRGIPLVRGIKAEDKREAKKKPQRHVYVWKH
jgi:hypothetical protein